MNICAEINTQNILSNYEVLQGLAPKSCLAPTVKADAYGLGACDIVQILEAKSPSLYYVATLDEALELRPLTKTDIAVFGGVQAGQEDEFIASNITPALKSLEDIILWAKAAAKLGRKLPAQIHLDTAMNRTGVQEGDDAAAIEHLSGFDLRYLFSHFVSSEELDNPLNELQAQRFHQRVTVYEAAYSQNIKKSLANSSAVVNYPHTHLDMIRTGGGLWGIEMGIGQAPDLKPALCLKAKILQVSAVVKGESIGYNELYRATRAQKIATLAIGYADGLPWPISNQASFYWRGFPCRVIGSISMDLTTVILPEHMVDQDLPCAGDFMEIIGENQRIETLAKDADARAYELQIKLAGARRATRVITA